MPSPFPGMDPYLEQADLWQDVHETMITAARAFLVPQVRPGYIVRLEEQIYIRERPEDEQELVGTADVAVGRGAGLVPAAAEATLVAPVRGRLGAAVEEQRLSFIEVRDRRDRTVITVIELLSPSNKRGEDRVQYLAKRDRLLASPVSLVEIDLLRGGRRLPVEGLPQCDYYALVSQPGERPDVGLWPIRLRDRLPVLPIPLRPAEPPARLDLQEVLHRVYDEAGFADHIYAGQPDPPLRPEDAAWAQPLVPPP